MRELSSHPADAAIEAQNGFCEIVHRSRLPETRTVAKSPTLKIIAGRIERLRSLNRPTRDGHPIVVRHGGLRRPSWHGRARERESVMDEIEISLQAELHQVLDRLNADSG